MGKSIEVKGYTFEYKNLATEYDRFIMSTDTELCDVYGNWSTSKQVAYEYCRNMFNVLGGSTFTIVTANTFQFTVGFYFDYEGKDTFAYITRDHNWFCPVSKL